MVFKYYYYKLFNNLCSFCVADYITCLESLKAIYKP